MTRIQREEIAVADSPVCIYRIAPPGPRRGTILVAPLIGGGGLQQYGYYKDINRHGFELVSFDYRGHGKSGGRFTIRGSIEDTFQVATAVREQLGDEPLLGMGNCYGSIPLLLAEGRRPGLFGSVALFNPVPDLFYTASPRDVLRNYWRPDGRLRLRNPLDLRGMTMATAERLFPSVDKSRNHFGILRYERTRELTCALEYLFHRPMRRLHLPELPALVIYGRSDHTLGLSKPETERDYRQTFTRILPRSEFRALPEVDHYWTECYGRANEVAFEYFTSPPSNGRPFAPGDPEATVVPRPPAPLSASPARTSSSAPTS